MKPLEEQNVLVTGATAGIGLGTARALAHAGATVLVHGRDPGRVAAARESVASGADGGRTEGYVADLASLAEVRRLAAEIARSYDRLDVLVNNAGVGRGPRGGRRREESADGHELRFAVNYLAPFLLQQLLLPLLRRAAPARIVNVASIGQAPIDFDDVMLERDYDGMLAYCRSKLALVMASFELAARLDPNEVTVNALHPGTLLDTKMAREFGAVQGPVDVGIEAEVHLATAPELEGVTGEYFDRTERARADAQAYDPASRRELWRLSERLTGIAL